MDIAGHPFDYLASSYQSSPSSTSVQLLNQSTAHDAQLAQVCVGQKTEKAG